VPSQKSALKGDRLRKPRRTGPVAAETRAAVPVIAVGASAGGLDTFSHLLRVFPPNSGMALIFVQHLDPTHKSMMVGLLAPHTKMPVREATNGAPIAPNTVYVIAPGTYVAVRRGGLVVTAPKDRHGARKPFDFLLQSLAVANGEGAIGVVLSGNGDDGSRGLRLVSNNGGLVVAQDPHQAIHDGMPQSAIDTSVVDLVLPIERIPAGIMGYAQQMGLLSDRKTPMSADTDAPDLQQITLLLRKHAGQDFAAYKPGTLMRRIRRRMAIQGIADMSAYLALLAEDTQEIGLLAKDLLIHVTSFFRDKDVFKYLSEKVIPDLVHAHPSDQPIRVWVPACSTGEEVYSLAMILLDEIAATRKNIKLQIFGSDIDELAVATARIGRYPAALADDVSADRLARFFITEADGYRIAPLLREAAIFTVQDVLTDPPFARIDLLSCRNLLIYLLPEAQERVLSLLHFALVKNGVLLLGTAESTGALKTDFEPISDDYRVYRRVGGGRKMNLQLTPRGQNRAFWPRPVQVAANREVNFSDLSRRVLLDSYAPASVLIDDKLVCIYYFGSTENYLHVPSGTASHNLLVLARQGLRSKLRVALQRARSDAKLAVVSGATLQRNGVSIPVRIEVRPVKSEDKEFFLVSLMDEPEVRVVEHQHIAGSIQDSSRVAELEKIVEALQEELLETSRELEISSADQEAINEEAQSLNEEFQSTNEELETSKEELQSLNEELTALNGQLTATVSQQRNTADDLENILRSSELAIVFLDSALNIRFFSSAAKTLLNAIESDIGRPVEDLAHRFEDDNLLKDIRSVLQKKVALSREVRSDSGEWYTRRILPYRAHIGLTEGVVVTFINISVMKAAEIRVEEARAYADNVIDTALQPAVVIDDELRIVSSNSSFRDLFQVTVTDSVGQPLTAIAKACLDVPVVNVFLDRTQAEAAPIENYEVEIVLPRGPRQMLLTSRKIPGTIGTGRRMLLAIDDITERKLINETLEIAKSKAEKANLGKSRFLAAASHDLRQPLQTLSLLHGVLARKATDPDTRSLIGKLDETLGAMSGMLDTLLDINQLEAGTVQPEIDDFAIGPVLDRLKTEFSYLARAKGIELHLVRSSTYVRSDPLLLAQMIRNLLANAVKYTRRGKIVVGCRRRGDMMRLEIWDTGIGIPSSQLKAIFEEYHQLGNPARERGLGLGLGLSIVHRIGELLGHKIDVRSVAGKGSVFSIEVPLRSGNVNKGKTRLDSIRQKSNKATGRPATILIIEDDPAVREALELLFKDENYEIVAAADGAEVTALLKRGVLSPDIVIADYNLPGGRTGLEIVTDLRSSLSRALPAIVLTGDIATDVLRKVVAGDCEYLHKPVNVDQLLRRTEDLIATSRQHPSRMASRPASGPVAQEPPTIFVVDDDEVLLGSMRDMLQQRGHTVETFPSAEAFLSAHGGRRGCLVVDSVMPGMSGLELLDRLKGENHDLPAIVITGHGDIPMAIKAMKVGAIDFIEKPTPQERLIASIDLALLQASDATKRSVSQEAAAASIAALTPRERAVMELVVQGLPNKQIAYSLDISQRTVETHRAAVMARTGSESLPDLIRLVMRAG